MERLTKAIPQDKGSLGEFADSMLEALPPRWRNWVVRGLFSIIMISTFTFIVNRGATWLMFLVRTDIEVKTSLVILMVKI